MFLEGTKELPTILSGIDECSFRSYHILQKVIQMVARGDTRETIIEIADYLEGSGRLREIYTENWKDK